MGCGSVVIGSLHWFFNVTMKKTKQIHRTTLKSAMKKGYFALKFIRPFKKKDLSTLLSFVGFFGAIEIPSSSIEGVGGGEFNSALNRVPLNQITILALSQSFTLFLTNRSEFSTISFVDRNPKKYSV
jgi:hypothetical protein